MSRRAVALLAALLLVPVNLPGGAALPDVLPIAPVHVEITFTPDDPRALTTVTFHGRAESAAPILARSWRIETAEGEVRASGESVSVVFGTMGVYRVEHHVTDALGRRASNQRMVVVENTPPRADMVLAPDPVFRGAPVVFRDNSTDDDGHALVATWDFSDGLRLTGEEVTRTFDTLGDVMVTLTVRDPEGARSSAMRAMRVLNAPPSVEASFTPQAPVANEPVTFSAQGFDPDASGGEITFAWSFSDGVKGTGATLVRSFAAVGNYSAMVRGTDADGASSAPFVFVVQVQAAAPSASFLFSPDDPRVGEPVAFTDTSTSPNGDIVEHSWEFGDGAVSNSAEPMHAFAESGTFLVRLTVRDAADVAATTTREVVVGGGT